MENAFLKKLRIKPQHKVLVINQPANSTEIFGEIPQEIFWTADEGEDFDTLIIFAITKAEMNQALSAQRSKIKDASTVWIFYPKAKSKLASDLNIMKSWDDLNQHQLEPCASAAVNEDWTGIRLKIAGTTKKSGVANQDIAKNDYAEFVDVTNKVVTLPEDVLAALQEFPYALAFYNKLAYSHKKEYVLWILTAKQEKTRVDRIAKMVEKLNVSKKNPSEK